MMEHFTLDLADENATLDFGARLAKIMQPNLTIFLQGNLGAGKTTLVRGLLRGLGFVGKVKSPTYTLLESYEISVKEMQENGLKLVVNHFDLYRFNDEEEWEAAGFREAFNQHSICLIEWPEKATNCLPAADIEISLTMPAHLNHNVGRTVTVKGLSVIGSAVCKNLL